MIAIMHVNVKKDFWETVLFAMVRKFAISSFSDFHSISTYSHKSPVSQW